MDDCKTYDLEDEPMTTRLPHRLVEAETEDEGAPITLRSPESGIVLRPRESQVTFAS